MLDRNKSYKNVVLVGSTSDIGLAILKEIPYSTNAEILLVGRAAPENFNVEGAKVKIDFHKCDLERFEDLERFASQLLTIPGIDLAIMAAGFLPPENEELNLHLVNKSMMINTVGVINALTVLAERMKTQKCGQILHISSVAAMLPRSRNFTYGASKSSADFFARGLSSKYRKTGLKISVLRPGYVHSKMTTNFKPAPFAINKGVLSQIAVSSLKNEEEMIYAPRKLRVVMKLFSCLPIKVRYVLSR